MVLVPNPAVSGPSVFPTDGARLERTGRKIGWLR